MLMADIGTFDASPPLREIGAFRAGKDVEVHFCSREPRRVFLAGKDVELRGGDSMSLVRGGSCR